MVDIATGKLEWVVNGYQSLEPLATMKADGSQARDESQPERWGNSRRSRWA